MCGQCIYICPANAFSEKSEVGEVLEVLNNPNKHVVVQVAPAIRTALGEEFGLPYGTNVTGKIPAAAKVLGFDQVLDTKFAADLTIMEEGSELLHRIHNNGILPMMTSCSPGWVSYCETFYPELIDHLSSCKSPHMMLGAMIKSHYAKKTNIDPKDIVTVSIMPCIAKKYEAQREEFEVDGIRDIDHVITTREFAAMIKAANIEFVNLADEPFDSYYGESGAGLIFGATGGVMETALRTVTEKLAHLAMDESELQAAEKRTGQALNQVEFTEARGSEGIKEVTVKAGDVTVHGLIINGVGNSKEVLDAIREGTEKSKYHFIEVMGCPGGCVMGGGQPMVNSRIAEKEGVFEKRANVLYNTDQQATVRRSHENPEILALYEEFLGEPNGEVAHKYLHTHYKPRI